MNKKLIKYLPVLFLASSVLSGCANNNISSIKIERLNNVQAVNGPGEADTWAKAQKQGVGTANNYTSKVWFTLADGAISEVYYPTIDTADVKDLKFFVTDGKTFVSDETKDAISKVEKFSEKSLGYKIINTDKGGRYRITKEVFTDVKRNSLIMKTKFEALKGNIDDYKLYVMYDPHVKNQGKYNEGYAIKANDDVMLMAKRDDIYTAMSSDIGWKNYSIGYYKVNDIETDLYKNMQMTYNYDSARGNIIEGAEIDLKKNSQFEIVLSFGQSEDEAVKTNIETLNDNYDSLKSAYIDEWEKYCNSLNNFDGKANSLYF
ncbi:MAG: glucan 1,4-alpha-glucosidase, partial [Thermoanaerobacterium sp.]|nr:glucan 1,4-alpha-glucosidase [Thermoanaerobacterium sp.]